MRHCPRCKSTDVSAHYTPKNAWDAEEQGFSCAACNLLEARYVTDPDFYEWKARWQDQPTMSYEELAASVARGVAIDDERERDWTWPSEHKPSSYDRVTDPATRAAKLAEHFEDWQYAHTTVVDNELAYSYHKRLPQNPALFARVLAEVESDEPRQLYAAWLRTTSDPRAGAAAEFIDCQLRIARALRENVRADVTKELPDEPLESPKRA
jgi:hypothetical protein